MGVKHQTRGVDSCPLYVNVTKSPAVREFIQMQLGLMYLRIDFIRFGKLRIFIILTTKTTLPEPETEIGHIKLP